MIRFALFLAHIALASAFTVAPFSASSVGVKNAFALRCGATTLTMHAESSRRDAVKFLASSAALFALPQNSFAKKTSASSEDTIAAVQTLVTVQGELKTIGDMLSSKDFKGVLELFEKPEFADIETVLLKLVNGPILTADDKKTIGTRKRYGVAADVLYGVGGIKAGIEAIDTPQLEACSAGQCSGDFVDGVAAAKGSLKSMTQALKEILTICKAYKEFGL